MAKRSAVWLVVLGLGSSGCSLSMMRTAPSAPAERTRAAAKRCTNDVLWPVLDTLGAGVGVANVVIAQNAAPGDVRWYGIDMDAKIGTVLGATQLAVFGASAVYGYVQAVRCENLRDEFEEKPDFDAETEQRKTEPEPEERPDDHLFNYE